MFKKNSESSTELRAPRAPAVRTGCRDPSPVGQDRGGPGRKQGSPPPGARDALERASGHTRRFQSGATRNLGHGIIQCVQDTSGLEWVEWRHPPHLPETHVHLEPLNVVLFGNRALQV